MNTVTSGPKAGTNGGGGRKRRWDAGIRAGVISAVVGVLALIVALLTWLLPLDRDNKKNPDGGPPPTTTTTTGPAQPATTTAAVYLFPPESGAAGLVDVPRAIRGKAGYTGHEIAVRCPSNETGDQTSDVTYLMQKRYVQFDVTVHPYFPAGTDQQAATYVTALIGVRQSDGGLDTRIAGDQKRATPNAPATLSAPLDDAEKLTLRIQCGNPNGTVVLTEARLTAA